MYMKNLEQELKENAYPGRGIVIGESRMSFPCLSYHRPPDT